MPSVKVIWSGSCADARIRDELCARLRWLGSVSKQFFEDDSGVRFFDGVLEGTVVVGVSIFDRPPEDARLVEIAEAPEQGRPPIELRSWGPLEPPKVSVSERLYRSVAPISVSGLEFRLFDWRGLYKDDDRASFVFATLEGCADLDGRLVEVHPRHECQTADDELVRAADWYLTQPSIHLRYRFEQWIDALLGTVKYLYLPDLDFWRYEHLSGYDELSAIFDRYDPAKLPLHAFATLAVHLSEESRNIEIGRHVPDFWSRLRRLGDADPPGGSDSMS